MSSAERVATYQKRPFDAGGRDRFSDVENYEKPAASGGGNLRFHNDDCRL